MSQGTACRVEVRIKESREEDWGIGKQRHEFGRPGHSPILWELWGTKDS
jgi:hypothetical protein